jgi:hypothetical protein
MRRYIYILFLFVVIIIYVTKEVKLTYNLILHLVVL